MWSSTNTNSYPDDHTKRTLNTSIPHITDTNNSWRLLCRKAKQSLQPDNARRKKSKLYTCRNHWSSFDGWKQWQLLEVSQHSQLSSYSTGQIYLSNWYLVSQRTDSRFQYTLKIRKKTQSKYVDCYALLWPLFNVWFLLERKTV